MAEPERRRRRLRHRSSGAPAPEVDNGAPADDGIDPPVTNARPGPPAARSGGAAPRQPVARPGRNAGVAPGPGPGPGPGQAETPPIHDPVTAPVVRGAEEREAERGLRGLVGSGSSQVSPTAALRARDAARPTDADTAAAERDLVIIRRNWVPREDLPPRR
jgi:hypothetical protein